VVPLQGEGINLGSECCTVIVIVLCGVLCSVGGCKSCVVDGVCGVCSDGFSLEGGKCVSSGTNRGGLSTGAIAGIAVAAVIVVGGLVGFLCWWFLCRGKA
ncbi:Variant-specific surface protein, partial [Giardia duodenalis]